MSEKEYSELAEKSAEICKGYGVPFAVNSFWKTAAKLGIKIVHLPLHILREMSHEEKAQFDVIGTSTHSKDDAIEAEALGAGYIIAGHIFETDCKKGLAGRGLGFLEEVKKSVKIPVYAIGGISPENAADCIRAGADGICMMSGFMQAEDVSSFMENLKNSIKRKEK
ncbi:thiamine-phosphate pyrophosphorylase [Ruminococcus albus]|uniref:Thiamine-phosphate pyrophosphorylase n=2 Tax=Ruminococcus albus TaxID=1264 RepID=A0A1H7L671_RUMAL|nr:thiamine-phosphate pyrophosphorylase [Ruminococcus albus]